MQMDLALLGLRLTLGSIFIVHACDKIWLGKVSGFLWELDNWTVYFTQAIFPFAEIVNSLFPFLNSEQAFWLALITASIELIAGWFLVLGIANRIAGLLLTLMMGVAIYFHFPQGFYGSDGGYEWAMLCLGGSQVIMLLGEGSFSLSALYRAVSTEQTRSI